MPASIPKLVLDTLKGSGYESNTDVLRIMRGFVCSQLDTTLPFDVIRQAIFRAGLPQRGDPHPTELLCYCVGHRIKLENDSVASGSVIYETPRSSTGRPKGQSTANVWTFRDSTGLQSIQTSINPADNGRPIYVQYAPAGDKNAAKRTSIVPVPYMRPVRVYIATGTSTTPPVDDIRNSVGMVNGDKFLGLNPGFWLYTGLDVDTKDWGKTYQIEIRLSTLVNEDWSSYAVAKNPDGTPVVIDPNEVSRIRNITYNVNYSATVSSGGNVLPQIGNL